MRTSGTNGINNDKCTFYGFAIWFVRCFGFSLFIIYFVFCVGNECGFRGCGCVCAILRAQSVLYVILHFIFLLFWFRFVLFSLSLFLLLHSKSLHYVTFLFNVAARALASATILCDATVRNVLLLWLCFFILFAVQLQRNGSCFFHVE